MSTLNLPKFSGSDISCWNPINLAFNKIDDYATETNVKIEELQNAGGGDVAAVSVPWYIDISSDPTYHAFSMGNIFFLNTDSFNVDANSNWEGVEVGGAIKWRAHIGHTPGNPFNLVNGTPVRFPNPIYFDYTMMGNLYPLAYVSYDGTQTEIYLERANKMALKGMFHSQYYYGGNKA